MNPSTQSPPPDHRAPKRHMARELAGLFLVSAGTIGLIASVYSATPLGALALMGIALIVGGGSVLYISPPLHPVLRLTCGYCALVVGMWALIGLAVSLNPWSLLFALLLAVGVFLSSESDEA